MPTFPVRSLLLSAFVLPLAWGDGPAAKLNEWANNPDGCERPLLLQYLRHEDVRVRSAALDLLESVTGKDFGLDPWLPPAKVPQNVQQELEAWSRAGDSLGSAGQPPTPEQLADAIALLRTADPDTQRRICLRFSRYKKEFTAALQRAASAADVPPQEADRLRCAQYRAQLQGSGKVDAGHVAALLTSHARNDTLEGLELLREAGKEALPVLMQFAEPGGDVLVREVAVDVLMQKGRLPAFLALHERLMQERDRNILQIAARRAIDCLADVRLVDFLNQCALSEDEDIAVAGLEALGALSGKSEKEEGEELTLRQAKLAGHAMPADKYAALLRSPHWRVRHAALNALCSKASFLPSLNDDGLQAAVSACLKDPDETVRQTALLVLHKRKLAGRHMAELEAFALATESSAPYVIYLFCAEKIDLSPALLELLERFTPRQVEQLAFYDDEYQSVFDTSSPGAQACAAMGRLAANPDPRVRNRLVEWCGTTLYGQLGDEGSKLYAAWLQDAAVAEEDKRSGIFMLMGRLGSDKERMRLREDAALKAALLRELGREGAGPAWLSAAKAMLLFAYTAEFMPRAGEWLPQLDDECLVRLFEKAPAGALFRYLDQPAFNRLVNSEFGLSYYVSYYAMVGSAKGLSLLAHMVLNDEQWADLWSRRFLNGYEDLPERLWVPQFLSHAVAHDPSPRHRLEAAYLLRLWKKVPRRPESDRGRVEMMDLDGRTIIYKDGVLVNEEGREEKSVDEGVADETLTDAEPENVEPVPVLEIEALDAVLQSAPPALADAVECMRQAPLEADEVLPWAERFAKSADPFVRRTVASCLLPVEGWLFCLPAARAGERIAYVKAPMLHVERQKRKSCPAALLTLVRGMQQDPDPNVALVACASLLYRTGNCDFERMRVLLDAFKERRERAEEGDKSLDRIDAEAQAEALGEVWSRWDDFRAGVREPFKLKGNPKNTSQVAIRRLRQLGEVVGGQYNMDESLRKKWGIKERYGSHDSDSDDAASQLMPHEFSFGLPGSAEAQPAADSASDPAAATEPTAGLSAETEPEPGADNPAEDEDETDAPEPQPLDRSLPVRVEWFHKKGCDECARVRANLEELGRRFPGLQVTEYDIASDEGYERNDVLCRRFGVPHKDRHKAPALFAEGGCLLGEEAAGRDLAGLLEVSLARGQESRRLAASPRAEQAPAPAAPQQAGQPDAPAADKAAEAPPAPGKLAAASATEKQAAASARLWEDMRRYGLLALGGAVFLFGLLVAILGRGGKGNGKENDGQPDKQPGGRQGN